MNSVEISCLCPYCEYVCAAVVRNILGERQVLTCPDCRELFVVEASVPRVELRVRALKDVDGNAVLDRLSKRKPAEASAAPPPPSAAAEQKTPPEPPKPVKPARAHLNAARCWCRAQPASEANPWCAIPAKSAADPMRALERTNPPRRRTPAAIPGAREVTGSYGGDGAFRGSRGERD